MADRSSPALDPLGGQDTDADLDRVGGSDSSDVVNQGAARHSAIELPRLSAVRKTELPLSITPNYPDSQPVDSLEDSDRENFRYELEFLEQKSGVAVKIRERTRFTIDGKRPSNVLGVFACGHINKRQLKALRAKTLPPGIKAALSEGDISYEVLEQLFKRPGKGATTESRKAGRRFRQNQVEHDG